MTDALRKEREQLLNRLVEIQAEMNRLETPALRKPEPDPAIGQVWRAHNSGRKFVLRTDAEVLVLGHTRREFEFVCARAHEDGDFSYTCGDSNCRCMQ